MASSSPLSPGPAAQRPSSPLSSQDPSPPESAAQRPSGPPPGGPSPESVASLDQPPAPAQPLVLAAPSPASPAPPAPAQPQQDDEKVVPPPPRLHSRDELLGKLGNWTRLQGVHTSYIRRDAINELKKNLKLKWSQNPLTKGLLHFRDEQRSPTTPEIREVSRKEFDNYRGDGLIICTRDKHEKLLPLKTPFLIREGMDLNGILGSSLDMISIVDKHLLTVSYVAWVDIPDDSALKKLEVQHVKISLNAEGEFTDGDESWKTLSELLAYLYKNLNHYPL